MLRLHRYNKFLEKQEQSSDPLPVFGSLLTAGGSNPVAEADSKGLVNSPAFTDSHTCGESGGLSCLCASDINAAEPRNTGGRVKSSSCKKQQLTLSQKTGGSAWE